MQSSRTEVWLVRRSIARRWDSWRTKLALSANDRKEESLRPLTWHPVVGFVCLDLDGRAMGRRVVIIVVCRAESAPTNDLVHMPGDAVWADDGVQPFIDQLVDGIEMPAVILGGDDG